MLTLTHNLPVTSVVVSAEGNYLATGTVDGLIISGLRRI